MLFFRNLQKLESRLQGDFRSDLKKTLWIITLSFGAGLAGKSRTQFAVQRGGISPGQARCSGNDETGNPQSCGHMAGRGAGTYVQFSFREAGRRKTNIRQLFWNKKGCRCKSGVQAQPAELFDVCFFSRAAHQKKAEGWILPSSVS